MPNMSVEFEDDGIYSTIYFFNLWKEFQELKHYLEHEYIDYSVVDFQD